ncbi:class I SAM-dependent methyltransferase [Rhodobacteraceae bacterium N5(2021)]|uniref:Class I SAM-dependent methyltransferase n=1 Tax=Gymnodinialimonas phycosphaerae TaxID=2841589 RepID=A0A975TTG3_9RHOB|nr:class I SAM-dependent methyltransferase [Gymnodinialimonas phycosphaerae]MBY4894591.1 class I SAM-dependent methyltransferase [Gymnodinialimonas phycosphaerae]
MADRKDHWDKVYAARDEAALTWFERTPDQSVSLIARYGTPEGGLVDIGGGASRLPDALLDAGFRDISVLDLSGAALDVSRKRLGARAEVVNWITGSVTEWKPDRVYAIWHDRAVFHFLVDAPDRAAYLHTMDRALAEGGHAIIATFAEDGPETCSNLPVRRYHSDDLIAEVEATLPGRFRRVDDMPHVHITPKGNRQPFQITVLRKL